MTAERARGAILYALFAVALLIGSCWYATAKPVLGDDPRVTAGRARLERLVPNLPLQTDAETTVLAARERSEHVRTVRPGAYELVAACVGDGQVRIHLGDDAGESGRAVPCADGSPQPIALSVALGNRLLLTATAETSNDTVFRWRIIRSRTM